jgi:PAS domain S-box-containing protein
MNDVSNAKLSNDVPHHRRQGSGAGMANDRRSQRTRAEQTIYDTEYANRVLSALVDTLPVGIIIADADGRLLTTNQAGSTMLGGPVLGTVQQPKHAFKPYDHHGNLLAPADMPLMKAWKYGQSPRDVEMLLRFPNGEEIILSVSAQPLRDDEGHIAGAVMTFQDITEQRQREGAYGRLLARLATEQEHTARLAYDLRRERDLLETIMENTHAQLAYLDTSFNFVRVNAAYAESAGKPVEALIGRNHFHVFPDAENQRIFEEVRNTGRTAAFAAKAFVFPDQPDRGTTYWDWSLVAVKNKEGEVAGLVLSLLDVTDTYRAQAEIASVARFPNENPHPVLRINEEGTLLYANVGSTPVRSDWGIEVGEKVPFRWRKQVRDAIRSEQNSSAEIHAGGRIYSLTVAPTADGYANLYGLDITDLRQAQRSLHEYAGRLRALHHIDQAILAAQSMEAIAEAALAHLPQMMNCVRASVMLLDFETQEASLLAVYTLHGTTQAGQGWKTPLTPEWEPMITKLRKGESVLITDVQSQEYEGLVPVMPLADVMKEEGVRALLVQPMRAQGRLIGTLRLGLPHAGAVSHEQLELARELADQLAIAIEQARLHRQVREHAEQLERRVIWRTAALRISEARFRAIFEDAPVGIALLDHKERIIQSNAALERILNTKAENLRDQRLSHFLNSEDQRMQAQLYTKLMQAVAESYRTQVRFVPPAERGGEPGTGFGTQVWCNLTLSLVRDVEHEPRLAVAMIEDITEQREAQAAMIQNEKLALTGQLAASFAHEINNPLQTVIGCLGLAEESIENEAPVRIYLDMASAELKRAAGIVGRLRELNRPSQSEDKQIRSLEDLVTHSLAIAEKQCHDRGIEVELLQKDEEKTLVKVVPDRIQQVFLNLILNAIDAMPHGGRLSVTVEQTEEPTGGLIVFRDTGVGIPPEIQSRLFNPFHTTKPEGLGLGLFISQSIIQEHGGEIQVESAPGQGTSFTIWLPR